MIGLLTFACALATSYPAIDDKPRLLTAADTASMTWRSVGPTMMSGRVSDISLSPSDRHTFLVAYGHGGVWRTTNGGLSLTPIFDKEGTSSVGSVVLCDDPKDPKDGKNKIIWVGTGEGNGRNSSSWGDGVYRSTDAGATWTNTGLKNSKDVPRLAVDPKNPDVCYAAALGALWGPNEERGIYKTEDGGKTWNQSLIVDKDTGAIDVVMHPTDPKTLYAAMYARRRTPFSFESGGKEGGIYRTTDGGKKWSKMIKGLPAQTGRIGLDISKSNPKVVMAVVESDEGGGRNIDDDRSRNGGVFRTEDGGDTWKRVNALAPRAFYFSKIKIDPTNDQNVWMLGWNIYKSEDGGETFRQNISNSLHVDWHAMAIDPRDPERIVAGSDGGAYQTRDGGKSWDHMNQNAVGLCYNVAVDNSTPYRIATGLQDNNSWLGISASAWTAGGRDILPSDWKSLPGGDGFHVAFDPTDNAIVYAESQGGDIYRIHLAGGGLVGIKPNVKEGQTGVRFNWNSPFFTSVHEPKTVYLAGSRVVRLKERGDQWEFASPDLTTSDPIKSATTGSNAETFCTIVALAESRLAKGLLWAGTDDGLIHVTTDGANWKDVTPKQVKGQYVAKLWPSNHNKNRVYAAIDKHRTNDYDPLILASDDLGKSWRDITGDLPKGGSSRTVAEDPVNPEVLYVGTETGIFVSGDRGKSWVKLGSGLPTVPVLDIAFQERERDIVIATHGRSIWILDDTTGLQRFAAKEDFALFPPKPARPYLTNGHGGLDGDRPQGFANPPTGALIHYWLKADAKDAKITIKNAKGVEVASLTGPATAGINRVTWDLRPKGDLAVQNRGEEGDRVFVPAGKYSVTVKVGDWEKTTEIEVGAVPG